MSVNLMELIDDISKRNTQRVRKQLKILKNDRDKLRSFLLCDKNDISFTSLHFAVRFNSGEHDIAELLLDSLAGDHENLKKLVLAKASGGNTALHYASSAEVVEVLLRSMGHDKDGIKDMLCAKDDSGWTPLHFAVLKGTVDVVEIMFKYAYKLRKDDLCQVFSPCKYGTLLKIAVDGGERKMITTLVNSKFININDRVYIDGQAELHLAVLHSNLAAVDLLLEHGADVNVTNEFGCTPIYSVTSVPIAESLIKHGAVVNAKEILGCTPLHSAAQSNNVDIIKFLLQNGACYDYESFQLGATPLQHAHHTESKEAEEYLTSIYQLFEATKSNNIQKVKTLLKSDVVVDAVDSLGRSALHYAVHRGSAVLVNVFMAAKADPTVVSSKGNTILHIAASKGNKRIIESALDHVRKDKLHEFINTQTSTKRNTALHVAAETGCKDIVALLVLWGASIDVENSDGKVALDLSTDKNISRFLRAVTRLSEID